MSGGTRSALDSVPAAAVGLTGAVAVGVYAVRPDLLPGGFHGLDLLLVLCGWSTVRWVRAGVEGGRALRALAVVVAVCAMGAVAAALLERGPNRVHDAQGILAAVTGTLDWALQAGFEAPGSYATIVQGLWVAGAVAQLAVVTLVLMAVLCRTTADPVRAGIRLSAVAMLLSYAYAAIPGVYLPFNGYFSFASRGWEFAVGCLLAFAVGERRPLPARVAAITTVVGLAGFAACAVLAVPAATTNVSSGALLPVLCGATMVVGAASRRTRADAGSHPVWTGLAAFSLPLAFTPGVVVGVLAYVFPPVWVPGSNPVRDATAIAASLLSAALVLAAGNALLRMLRALPSVSRLRPRRPAEVRPEARQA